jgi:hypothetical protein
MNLALSRSDSERFRLVKGPDDFDRQTFLIRMPGSNWERFRTVLHIGGIYGRDYGLGDYFDELVAIGERIAKIVEERAGYARPDQEGLISVFGQYLAHYAVLNRLHSDTKARVQAARSVGEGTEVMGSDMKVDQSAVFPREIQGLVAEGLEAINRELMDWRTKAAA